MFRKSKAQGPCAFEIAAGKILKGWKDAGQPINTDNLPENKSSLTVNNRKRVTVIEKTSTKNNLQQFSPVLSNTSIDKLLQHANKLIKIA